MEISKCNILIKCPFCFTTNVYTIEKGESWGVGYYWNVKNGSKKDTEKKCKSCNSTISLQDIRFQHKPLTSYEEIKSFVSQFPSSVFNSNEKKYPNDHPNLKNVSILNYLFILVTPGEDYDKSTIPVKDGFRINKWSIPSNTDINLEEKIICSYQGSFSDFEWFGNRFNPKDEVIMFFEITFTMDENNPSYFLALQNAKLIHKIDLIYNQLLWHNLILEENEYLLNALGNALKKDKWIEFRSNGRDPKNRSEYKKRS